MKSLNIGFARMHLEKGEVRDFLPGFVSHLSQYGWNVKLEHGLGTGIGLNEKVWTLNAVPSVEFVSQDEVYRQDYVLVLRYPNDTLLQKMKKGSCLISMLHFPTRPDRVELMKSLGLEGVAIDMVKDDFGRRLVENLKSVGWNGVGVAFQVLREIYPSPGFESPYRPPIKVTLLGPGAVGIQAVQAAARYGDDGLHHYMAEKEVPGVQVNVLDYDFTRHKNIMLNLLAETDILIDASQRPDTSLPIIPNEWISIMPEHAVLLDLSVDPYDSSPDHYSIKGIEGMPQGNLDQYVFPPDDPAYGSIPGQVSKENRRYAVSCYSWPGLYPTECMQVYGNQLKPILRTIIEAGGINRIRRHGKYFHRAISKAMLSQWETWLD